MFMVRGKKVKERVVLGEEREYVLHYGAYIVGFL